MPEFSTEIRDKIAELRTMQAASQGVETFELCKIEWPSPDGSIYYASTQVDEVASVPPAVSPIETRLIADSLPDMFLPVKIGDEIGDEEVNLKFWDGDEVFSDLMVEHGEGIKVELFYWFPQVELLLPVWHGHLRNEDDAGPHILPVKAVQGFRSSEGTLPSRAHYEYCNAVFGGLLDTQDEIDEHGCPYNFHIGGGVGNNDPDTGLPWTYCNRLSQSSCTARDVNPLYHLSHATIQSSVANGQTQGPTLYSTTFGNQTSLKEPVAVVMGRRRVRSMPLIAYRRDLNNNHPEDGWFQTQIECCEGPIQAIQFFGVTIGGVRLNDPAHYTYRLGQFGQTPTYNLTTHGFSHTANFRYTYGQIDPATVNPSDVSGDAVIEGLNNIRVYSDEDTYSETYSTNPVWQLAQMLTNKIWGYGLDYDRLNIASWIEAADWCDEYVRFTDTNGDTWDHQRATSNVELRGKKVQQQVEDLCRSHRLSRPFLFDGSVHIVPLRALTEGELADVPVFTDTGENRNICVTGDPGNEVSTLKISRRSDLDLSNRIEITYDNVAEDWLETPLRPVEDVTAQLRAGRVVGDKARKINTKKFNVLGVTDEPQAMKLAWAFLDLGEFDEGGLANNLGVKMTIWYLDSLDLHPAKVIRVNSSRLTKYDFTYFRVRSMERQNDLQVELELQAYNETYMEDFEVLLADIIIDPPDDPTPAPPDSPFPDDPPNLPQRPQIIFQDGMIILQQPSTA